MANDVKIGLVGSGGDGVVAAGDIIVHAMASCGLYAMMMKSFGPQIRGGESSARIRLSSEKVHSLGDGLDTLVVMNWCDYLKFAGELELNDNAILIVDEKDDTRPDDSLKLQKVASIVEVPITSLAESSKNPKGKNMVVLGILAGMFGLSEGALVSAIQKRFAHKGEGVVSTNVTSFNAGFKYAKSNIPPSHLSLQASHIGKRLVITGNEAIALGALAAGCRFYSGYPITPASEIMEWLGEKLPLYDGMMVQAEDEIAAICMTIGASYGGVRAMTATSGPGLSLMMESIGLASMAEIPCVIVDVQRGGPSTGIPTKSEQADLMQAVYGMHGDAPHAVIAVDDVETCFEVMADAFEIAERYQMPVIALSDQFIGHRTEVIGDPDLGKLKRGERLMPQSGDTTSYKRFEDRENGVSPMSVPGMEGFDYICSGIEHDEFGSPSSSHVVHEKMCAKRARKLEHLRANFKPIQIYGSSRPKVALITWGSNSGVVREAVERLVSLGIDAGVAVPRLIYPLQTSLFEDFLKEAELLLVVENSYSGQFFRYLKSYIGMPDKAYSMRSSGAKIFMVKEVVSEILKVLK
jgi:2-oxoglutarate ferredoxin oxidoreductase subunit alpha